MEMTELRQRMLDAMILRGYAQRTQEAYIGAVALLARHYKVRPDALSEQQVQQYLLHLHVDLKRSASTVNQYGSAFRFFFGDVLGLQAQAFQIPMAAAPVRLPEILSREEISRLLAAARSPAAHAFLALAYSSGLRLSELRHLRVGDIDSHSDRMCLRVQQGKGAKDRYVPLAPDALQLLRQWWRQARLSSQPQQWLFPGQGEASQPVSDATPQKWYHAARAGAGITKQGGIHLLRHCYATHLLEAGVDLYTLSRWLGHNHVSTTSRYLHLARPDAPDGARRDPCALLSALPTLSAASPESWSAPASASSPSAPASSASSSAPASSARASSGRRSPSPLHDTRTAAPTLAH
jgi:integrase/recombinase XerD